MRYRVIEFVDGTPCRQTHEVYDDDQGRPVAYTAVGDPQDGLVEWLDRMRACLDEPVLVEVAE